MSWHASSLGRPAGLAAACRQRAGHVGAGAGGWRPAPAELACAETLAWIEWLTLPPTYLRQAHGRPAELAALIWRPLQQLGGGVERGGGRALRALLLDRCGRLLHAVGVSEVLMGGLQPSPRQRRVVAVGEGGSLRALRTTRSGIADEKCCDQGLRRPKWAQHASCISVAGGALLSSVPSSAY